METSTRGERERRGALSDGRFECMHETIVDRIEPCRDTTATLGIRDDSLDIRGGKCGARRCDPRGGQVQIEAPGIDGDFDDLRAREIQRRDRTIEYLPLFTHVAFEQPPQYRHCGPDLPCGGFEKESLCQRVARILPVPLVGPLSTGGLGGFSRMRAGPNLTYGLRFIRSVHRGIRRVVVLRPPLPGYRRHLLAGYRSSGLPHLDLLVRWCRGTSPPLD